MNVDDQVRALSDSIELSPEARKRIWAAATSSASESAAPRRAVRRRPFIIAIAIASISVAGAASANEIGGALFSRTVTHEAKVAPYSDAQAAALERDCHDLSFGERRERADATAGRESHSTFTDRQNAFYKAMALCADEVIGEGEFQVRGPKPAGVEATSDYRFDAGPSQEIKSTDASS